MSEALRTLVDGILNEKIRLEHRAIALFELQVWISYPGPHAIAKTRVKQKTEESEKMCKRARIFAASKILDHLMEGLREGKGSSFSILHAASDPLFRELFDRYLTSGRGLYDLRNTPGGNAFRDDLLSQQKLGQSMGAIVGFCLMYSDTVLRSSKYKKNKKARPLGFEKIKVMLDADEELAIKVLGDAKSLSTLSNHRRRFFNSAPFIFLMSNPDVPKIFPENCRSKRFAEELLKIAGDRSRLSRFFGLYEATRTRLALLGYSFPETGVKPLQFAEVPSTLSFDPDLAHSI